jgi:hypothetical protein
MLTSAIPMLVSLNEDEIVKFYTEKLGFIFHSSWEGHLIFSRDGVFIHLWPHHDANIAQNTGCYVNVTGVESLYKEYNAWASFTPTAAIWRKSPGR